MAMIDYVRDRFEKFTEEEFGHAGIRYTCLYMYDGKDSIAVLSNRNILGKGKDKQICALMQELNQQVNIRLMPSASGRHTDVWGVLTNKESSIKTIEISEDLYQVANNIGEYGSYKEVYSRVIPNLPRIYITGDYNLNDLPPSFFIAVAKECVIRDFSEIDKDANIFARLYCEDRRLQNILSDYAYNGCICRNKFIDMLIEAGYEEWI